MDIIVNLAKEWVKVTSPHSDSDAFIMIGRTSVQVRTRLSVVTTTIARNSA